MRQSRSCMHVQIDSLRKLQILLQIHRLAFTTDAWLLIKVYVSSDKRPDPLTIPCDEVQAHALNKLIVLVTKLLKKLAADRYRSVGAARAGANRKHK